MLRQQAQGAREKKKEKKRNQIKLKTMSLLEYNGNCAKYANCGFENARDFALRSMQFGAHIANYEASKSQ